MTAAAQLPSSRWRARDAPSPAPRGATDRVRTSHDQARTTVRLAFVFLLAAAIAGAVRDERWLALHLFLAGGVVLAISGVSSMLTVTWSAAPAPPNRLVALQRACIAIGAAGVAVGRELDVGAWLLAPSGGLYVTGLVLLGVVLVTTARSGVERRFDSAVSAYLAALGAGVGGVALGVSMAIGTPSTQLRSAHVVLNLLGLVGLVVAGTLPYFAATVGRSRMAPHASRPRLFLAVGWQASALVVTTIGLVADAAVIAVAGLAAYAAGIVATLWLSPRPTRRQLRWAGPRLLALWAGATWWTVAVVGAAVDVAGGAGTVFEDRWLLVMVVGGYAQILWGSLAYLVPVLRGGGHEQLGRGFAATRSWIGLAAANLAALGFLLSLPPLAAVSLAIWVVDAAVRTARVELVRRRRGATVTDDATAAG